MRPQRKTKLAFVALIALLGLTLAFLAPSITFAEEDLPEDAGAAVEQPADAAKDENGNPEAAEEDVAAAAAEENATATSEENAADAAAPKEGVVETPAESGAEDDVLVEAADPQTPLLGDPTPGMSHVGINMRITAVNGTAVDPVVTKYVEMGSAITLTATTKAPAEAFTMVANGFLNISSIQVTNAAGQPVNVAIEGIGQGSSVIGLMNHDKVLNFSGLTAGTDLTIVITGTLQSQRNTVQAPIEALYFAEKVTNAYDQTQYTILVDSTGKKTVGFSYCMFGNPTLALIVQDQENNDLYPGNDAANMGGFQYLMGYMSASSQQPMTGAEEWQYFARQAGPFPTYQLLEDYIEGFVLKDSNGQVVETFSLEDGIAYTFDKLGTYTLDVQRKDGVTYEFDPVTIEVSLTQPSSNEMVDVMTLETDSSEQVGIYEMYLLKSGYEFKVNGEKIPLLTPTELMQMMMLSMPGGREVPISLPTELSMMSRAIGMFSVTIPAENPFVSKLTMKILEGSKKVEATTASYNDKVTWETTVSLWSNYGNPGIYTGSVRRLSGYIIELRYDVNNQSYPTGEGVNALFDYGKDPTVELVFNNGTKYKLKKGEDYILESPEGYFRVDEELYDQWGNSVSPSQFNGRWWRTWYENLSGSDNAPYFLHPYYQKQAIYFTIGYEDGDNEDLWKALADIYEAGGTEIMKVVVTNTGTLSEYAFTGGYGNPARAIGFAPPIYLLKSMDDGEATGLEENENSNVIPSYYRGNTCIGYDTTCVYTSAITVHKVDEDKKDLIGAEFTLTDDEGEPTGAKAIQGQAAHLVLSHFIPGFSVIRPVPKSVKDVSRRNLTSVGEPALKDTNPEGDPVGDDAYLSYAGLDEGSYVITESKAPTGYKSGQEIKLDLTASLPNKITTGYEFCRWNASVNGKPVAVVEQLADEYPDVDEDAYQFFSCNSSFIILRVTNKPNELTVKKEWDDDDDAASKRTSSVKVQLYSQDDASSEKVAYGDPVTLNEKNEWTYTWKKIDETKVWSIEEVEVPDGYTAEVTGDAEDGFTVTNTYEPPTTKVSVKKVWNDNDDAQGKRPESIEVQLYGEGSDGEKTAEGDSVTLDASNSWKHIWTKLDATKTWTVEEVSVPDDYTVEITGDAESGFTITNTCEPPTEPKTTNVSVKKVWKGDKVSKRPSSVKVQLYAQTSGGKTAYGDPVTLEASNGWKHIWTKLDATKAWTVEEVSVPKGYTAKVTGNAKDGFTVTNTYKPPKIPQTGDDTPMQAMWLLVGLAAVALAGGVATRRARR